MLHRYLLLLVLSTSFAAKSLAGPDFPDDRESSSSISEALFSVKGFDEDSGKDSLDGSSRKVFDSDEGSLDEKSAVKTQIMPALPPLNAEKISSALAQKQVSAQRRVDTQWPADAEKSTDYRSLNPFKKVFLQLRLLGDSFSDNLQKFSRKLSSQLHLLGESLSLLGKSFSGTLSGRFQKRVPPSKKALSNDVFFSSKIPPLEEAPSILDLSLSSLPPLPSLEDFQKEIQFENEFKEDLKKALEAEEEDRERREELRKLRTGHLGLKSPTGLGIPGFGPPTLDPQSMKLTQTRVSTSNRQQLRISNLGSAVVICLNISDAERSSSCATGRLSDDEGHLWY